MLPALHCRAPRCCTRALAAHTSSQQQQPLTCPPALHPPSCRRQQVQWAHRMRPGRAGARRRARLPQGLAGHVCQAGAPHRDHVPHSGGAAQGGGPQELVAACGVGWLVGWCGWVDGGVQGCRGARWVHCWCCGVLVALCCELDGAVGLESLWPPGGGAGCGVHCCAS